MYVRIAIRGAFPCSSSQSDVFANIKIFALSIDLAQFYAVVRRRNASRKAANVKKVTSSHVDGRTIVICEDNVDVDVIKNAIQKDGYNVGEVDVKPYEKKGLFSFFKKK